MAGSSCALALQTAGLSVAVFDKSRGVGGRMATRRIAWRDAAGAEATARIDHGAQRFWARHPRFIAVMSRAVAAGAASRWVPRVHAPWPAAPAGPCYAATPDMPALSRHLLAEVDVRLEHTVQRLQREGARWRLILADGRNAGPFDQVVLAMPPAQAAALLVGHHTAWADALAATRMDACWTLMAVTDDDTDWPWDAAAPERGPLAWIARNDRKPGRSAPPGAACWVAHASPAWSAPRLDTQDPQAITEALQQALQQAVRPHRPLQWHHASVHRWRYAAVSEPREDGGEAWWDGELGLGVCGDFLGGGDVEAAWRSGDELADTVAAWLDAGHGQALTI
jgi:hypothetical protein